MAAAPSAASMDTRKPHPEREQENHEMNPRPTAQWNAAPLRPAPVPSRGVEILKGVLLGLVYICAGIFVCWIGLMLAVIAFVHVFIGNAHF